MTRRTIPWHRSAARWSAALAVAIATAACSSPTGTQAPPSPAVSTPPSAPAASDAVSLPPPPTDTPIPSDVSDQPPVAALAAEGGDPVTGQLGTYIWRETGSDSPWLPGAAITVGSGEPLTVTLDPAVPVGSWQARYVPASSAGPDGAVDLGQGAGDPDFGAPPAGTWTVEVHVLFADGLGDANYFWKVAVD